MAYILQKFESLDMKFFYIIFLFKGQTKTPLACTMCLKVQYQKYQNNNSYGLNLDLLPTSIPRLNPNFFLEISLGHIHTSQFLVQM